MKKTLIIVLVIMGALIAYALIWPFFNTGLIISVTPVDSLISVDNKTYDQGEINLKPGNYPINISKYGYSTYQENIKIGIYGKKKINVSLQKKDLISEIPYSPERAGSSYYIDGRLDSEGLPIYEIHYATDEDKMVAEAWLNSKGIFKETDKIEYIVDGD